MGAGLSAGAGKAIQGGGQTRKLQGACIMTDSAADKAPPGAPARRLSLARLWPVAVIMAAVALFFLTGANRYLSLAAIRENYSALVAFVEDHHNAALALYMAAYIAAAAFSLPGATIFSLTGGLLFGTLTGTAAIVIAATIGATLIFLAARYAFAAYFRDRASGFLKRMEEGFNDNAFSYLLLLRLIPLFPFFVVNIVPAFTKIRTPTFMAATFVGIIPGAFAYASAGAGLGAVIEQGGEVELAGLLTQPEILTPIVALSVLAILPVAYRAFMKRKPARRSQ